MKIQTLIGSFLKIGFIGFGGGSALIPVVEREVVREEDGLDAEEYLKHTVIANITPGALPVKLGATCGEELGGLAGSLAGAFCVTLPGVLLTLLLMASFTMMGDSAIAYFNYASVGITAFIVFLLMHYVAKTLKMGDFRINLLLCILAAFLTGGKELYTLLALLGMQTAGTPLFDISTISLMIATFFMLLALCGSKRSGERLAAGVMTAGFVFFSGKLAQRMGLGAGRTAMALLMAGFILAMFLKNRREKHEKTKIRIARKTLLLMAAFVAVPAVAVTVCTALFAPDLPAFIGKTILSTVTSFGGGEAYVSVADGFFVQSGMVSAEAFYTQLVPVANALPGPILVKIASGVGYLYGGWPVAIAACTAAVGTCGAVSVCFASIYDTLNSTCIFY